MQNESNNIFSSSENLRNHLKRFDNMNEILKSVEKMSETEIAEKYFIYLKYKEHANLASRLVHEREADAWDVLMRIIEKSDNTSALSAAGVFILEEMLGSYPEKIIEKVENEARKSVKFQYVLSCVWKTFIEDKYWNRIVGLMTELGFDCSKSSKHIYP